MVEAGDAVGRGLSSVGKLGKSAIAQGMAIQGIKIENGRLYLCLGFLDSSMLPLLLDITDKASDSLPEWFQYDKNGRRFVIKSAVDLTKTKPSSGTYSPHFLEMNPNSIPFANQNDRTLALSINLPSLQFNASLPQRVS